MSPRRFTVTVSRRVTSHMSTTSWLPIWPPQPYLGSGDLDRAVEGVLSRAERDGLIDVSYAPPRAGDVRISQADVTKARNQLGYDPQVDLREGLRRTYEYMRADHSVIPAIHERRRWIAQAT